MESDVINNDNERYGTPGGNNTRDRVFCLSVDEIYRCYHFNADHGDEGWRAIEALITEATPHASSGYLRTQEITKEEYDPLRNDNYTEACIGKTGAQWWLRSPGEDSGEACIVAHNGYAGWRISVEAGDFRAGVRPAMRISR